MKKPTIKECFEWCNNMDQSIAFYNYFESVDWMVGKKSNAKPMTNWKSALTGWVNRNKKPKSKVDKALSTTNQEIAAQLWRRMTQIYGHKWVSSYGTEPSKPWQQVITRLTNEEIATGLEVILKNGDSWPPSLTEFYKFCKSKPKPLIAIKHAPSKKQIMEKRERVKPLRLAAMASIYATINKVN